MKDEDLTLEPTKVDRRVKYTTADEKRKAHIRSQADWNKRNPEKFKRYQKTYNEKEEVKAHKLAEAKKHYDINKQDPEFMEKVRTKSRERYQREKDDPKAQARKKAASERYYEKNKDKIKAKKAAKRFAEKSDKTNQDNHS